VSSAGGRADGVIRAAAERRPVGQNPGLAPETTPTLAGRAASGRRLQSAGRHFLDAAQRRALAGFARGVSVAVDLLATATGLGGARDLVGDLAGVSGGVK